MSQPRGGRRSVNSVKDIPLYMETQKDLSLSGDPLGGTDISADLDRTSRDYDAALAALRQSATQDWEKLVPLE